MIDNKQHTESSLENQFSPFVSGEHQSELIWLKSGISQQSDGSMSWDHENERVAVQNRRMYFQRCGLDPMQAVAAEQVHGTRIHVVTSDDIGRGAGNAASRIPATDGLITKVRGAILSTTHADCAPLYIADPRRKAVGLGHAGWRGILSGMAGEMMSAMQDAFGTRLEDLRSALGPTISSSNYEVGRDVADQFTTKFGSSVVSCAGGKNYLDLAGCIIIDLQNHGLPLRAVPARPPCTYADGRFASYRRDGVQVKNMVAWITIL